MTYLQLRYLSEKESKDTDFRRIQCEVAEAGFQIDAFELGFSLANRLNAQIDEERHQGGSNLKTRRSGCTM